jgi:hypothetical protein
MIKDFFCSVDVEYFMDVKVIIKHFLHIVIFNVYIQFLLIDINFIYNFIYYVFLNKEKFLTFRNNTDKLYNMFPQFNNIVLSTIQASFL